MRGLAIRRANHFALQCQRLPEQLLRVVLLPAARRGVTVAPSGDSLTNRLLRLFAVLGKAQLSQQRAQRGQGGDRAESTDSREVREAGEPGTAPPLDAS